VIDWATVAAYITPLIAGMVALGGFNAWLSRKRDERIRTLVNQIINDVVNRLEGNQREMQTRIRQVEEQMLQVTAHLNKQDDAQGVALQAIARIEGRLAGPIAQLPPT
jgi:sensor domain CHASE-containing protein